MKYHELEKEFEEKQHQIDKEFQEEFEELVNKMPNEINWADLASYEKTDMTIASQELACVASGCEI